VSGEDTCCNSLPQDRGIDILNLTQRMNNHELDKQTTKLTNTHLMKDSWQTHPVLATHNYFFINNNYRCKISTTGMYQIVHRVPFFKHDFVLTCQSEMLGEHPSSNSNTCEHICTFGINMRCPLL
jgi:hypothetical protein